MLPKKEGVRRRDELNRLEKYFSGLKDMNELPKALFVIDIGKEDICIAEARRMGVEIFAIVDTDCDPEKVTHTIPGNDDAVRSIRLIAGRMANAILEGQAQREAAMLAEKQEQELQEQAEMEALGLTGEEEEALQQWASGALRHEDDAVTTSDDSGGVRIPALERTVVEGAAPTGDGASE